MHPTSDGQSHIRGYQCHTQTVTPTPNARLTLLSGILKSHLVGTYHTDKQGYTDSQLHTDSQSHTDNQSHIDNQSHSYTSQTSSYSHSESSSSGRRSSPTDSSAHSDSTSSENFESSIIRYYWIFIFHNRDFGNIYWHFNQQRDEQIGYNRVFR